MAIDGNKSNRRRRRRGCLAWCCPTSEERRESMSEEDYRSTVGNYTVLKTLNAPLESGSYITIKGTIHPKCLRFSIDLICSDQNIAFHFNPRLEQRYVVRNCKTGGYWGDEETTSNASFNFNPGKPFTINILVTASEYMTMVNGRHFCSFAHRIPPKQVKMIDSKGSVEIDTVNVSEIACYPPEIKEFCAEVAFDEDYNMEDPKRLENPFTGILREGFRPGWQLEIYGHIKLLPHSFSVNLQDSVHIWPHPTIPLHLNPRFGTAGGTNSFVRNSWTSGWNNEERAPNFPFTPGYAFCLVIRMEIHGFSVWIDGKLTAEFQYANNDSNPSIRCIYVQGDIHLNHVTMRRQIKNAYFIDPNEEIWKI